ncbi:hypothetical protein ABID08_000239 [Rhizobium binae]|uniref:GNAT family N-acetyltransferase n=1 Tax=Rhizobium binae TaxID=1138190 RepID=A0ABV2M8V3_9HYPH
MRPDFAIHPAAAGDLSGLMALYRHLNPADPLLDDMTAEKRFSTVLAQPCMTVLTGFTRDIAVAT